MSERAVPYGGDARARLTRQGQTTVPKQVRDALGAEAGDELVFERRGGEFVLRHVPRRTLSGWAGAARATAPPWSGSDDELNQIVREEVAQAQPAGRSSRRGRAGAGG